MDRKHLLALLLGALVGGLLVGTGYETEVLKVDAVEEARPKHRAADEPDTNDGLQREAKRSRGGRSNLEKANDELAGEISDLNRRILNSKQDKVELEAQLKAAQDELARRLDSGAGPRDRNPFDLDQADWRELARRGDIKFRIPCVRSPSWIPDEQALNEMGMALDDGPVISDAYQHSNDRVWQVVRPLCIDAIGNSAVVDTLGADTCIHVVLDMARKRDVNAANEAMRAVAETRAGLIAPPNPDAVQHPVFQMFWTLTGEMPRVEAELTKTFGPAEAKRLAYDSAMCSGTSVFGGGTKSKAAE